MKEIIQSIPFFIMGLASLIFGMGIAVCALNNIYVFIWAIPFISYGSFVLWMGYVYYKENILGIGDC
jgi:hypothetical protein